MRRRKYKPIMMRLTLSTQMIKRIACALAFDDLACDAQRDVTRRAERLIGILREVRP